MACLLPTLKRRAILFSLVLFFLTTGCEGSSWRNQPAWINYRVEDGLADNNVHSIAVAQDGSLWLGTSKGVSHYDGKKWRIYTTVDGLAGNYVTAADVASDGLLWFGTGTEGVSRFDGETWTTYTSENGLASDRITAVAAAPDGSVWVGTSSSGVSHLRGDRWYTYTRENGLISNEVRSIMVDETGKVWVAGHGGISLFFRDTWTGFPIGGESTVVICIVPSLEGGLFLGFGNSGDGISRFDGNTFTAYSQKGDLQSEMVLSLYRSSDHSLWAGAMDGVTQFDGQNWIKFSQPDMVWDIAETPDGALWFGTAERGVYRFLPEKRFAPTSTDGADHLP